MAGDKSYDKLLIKISQNLKLYRKKKGLTQEDMADHGFNYRHYQKLEGGKYSPNLYTLHRLAKVFDVKVSELIEN